MVNLKLVEAFSQYGAAPANKLHSRSAMASDGSMVLGCSAARFGHPQTGVLRYEDNLSNEPDRAAESAALSEHLSLARDGKLTVRLIVIADKQRAEGKTTREVHVRPDLIGSVTKFDGTHYIVDFVRSGSPQAAKLGQRTG